MEISVAVYVLLVVTLAAEAFAQILKLNRELQMFQECTVHFLLNHVVVRKSFKPFLL